MMDDCDGSIRDISQISDKEDEWREELEEHPLWKKFIHMCEEGLTDKMHQFIYENKLPQCVLTHALGQIFPSDKQDKIDSAYILVECGADVEKTPQIETHMIHIKECRMYEAFKIYYISRRNCGIHPEDIEWIRSHVKQYSDKKFIEIFNEVFCDGDTIKPAKK